MTRILIITLVGEVLSGVLGRLLLTVLRALKAGSPFVSWVPPGITIRPALP